MSKKKIRKDGDLVLYTGPHHIHSTTHIVDVLMLSDCIAIKCTDNLNNKVYGQRISICQVSAMIQAYYYNLNTLWKLLADSMIFIGNEMLFSTEHICMYIDI